MRGFLRTEQVGQQERGPMTKEEQEASIQVLKFVCNCKN